MRTRRLWYAIASCGFITSCLLLGGGNLGNGAAADSSAAILAAETAGAGSSVVLDDPEPYVSEMGRFRFRFPGKPQLSDQKTVTSVLHNAVYEAPDGTAYMVLYSDLNAAIVREKGPDLVLDGGVDGLSKSAGWTTSSKKEIKLGDHQGRELTALINVADAPEPGFGRIRIYLVGNRLYQVMIIGPKSKSSAAAFDKYLDSFELVQAEPAPAAAKPARRPAPAPPTRARAGRQPMAKRTPRSKNAPVAKRTQRDEQPADTVIDDDPGPDPSKPAELAIDLKSTSARLVELPSEAARGRIRGQKFRETAPKGGLLVGARVGYVDAGGSKIGSIQPIFQKGTSYVEGQRHGDAAEGEATVVAKPGYVVGGVNTRTGLRLDAFQLVFMKFSDGRLDPTDSYASAWFGNPRGGNLRNVSGEGKAVTGVHGAINQRDVTSLGVVVAQ